MIFHHFSFLIAENLVNLFFDKQDHAEFANKNYEVKNGGKNRKYQIYIESAKNNRFLFIIKKPKAYIYYPKSFSYMQLDTTLKVATQLLFFGEILMMHASSIMIDNKAYVFSGKSGIGKSTIVRNEDYVLSDELTVIKKKAGIFYVYPSPFDKGRAPISYGAHFILQTIYFLKQSKVNLSKKLNTPNAFKLVLENSYVFYFYKSQIYQYFDKNTEKLKSKFTYIKKESFFLQLLSLIKLTQIQRLYFTLNHSCNEDIVGLKKRG